MRIVVQGAGAVGGYFGGKLANKGYDVTFLVRERRYKQLKERGLKVESVNGSFALNPNLVTKAENIENPDVVFIALKAYHLEGAMNDLQTLVQKGAKVIPLLNGVQHLDLLISKFGIENVLGGICYVESTLNEHGDIIQKSKMQDVIIGPLHESQTDIVEKMHTMMEAAEINSIATEMIIEEMWKKYIFLASMSGITTSMKEPIGVATSDPVTAQFLSDLVHEVYQIAVASGAKLPEVTVAKTLDKLHSLPKTMTSSMHRDFEKGLPLELDSLHRFLIQTGKEKGIETPVLQAIYALIHPYKNGRKETSLV